MAVQEAEKEAVEAERRRLYYVAMTRAIDRLIVSGSIDPERGADASTPIGWVLERIQAGGLDETGNGPVEIERDGARLLLRLDRGKVHEPAPLVAVPLDDEQQLALFASEDGALAAGPAPQLAELVPVPGPPPHRVRRLSFSSLAQFERCSYRFYAEKIVGSIRSGEQPAKARPASPRPRSAMRPTSCSNGST